MKKTAAALILIVLLAPALCMAQEKGPSFSFSFLKPSMEDTKMLNSAMIFGIDYPLNENLTIAAYIPYAMFQPDITGFDNESAMGNPHVGVRGMLNETLGFHFGVGLPFAPEDENQFALMTGMVADMTAFWNFIPQTALVDGGVMWWNMMESGLGLFAGGGFAWLVPEDEGTGEVFLPFYAGGMYNLGAAMVGAGLTGHYWLSSGDADGVFGDDALIWGLTLGAEFPLGAFTPNLYFIMPLAKDWSDDPPEGVGVGSVIGIGFKYTIMK
jgi:hypothetical protein